MSEPRWPLTLGDLGGVASSAGNAGSTARGDTLHPCHLGQCPRKPFTKIGIGVNRLGPRLCLGKNAALVWEMSPAGQLDQISFVGYETDSAHLGESELAVNLAVAIDKHKQRNVNLFGELLNQLPL